MEKVEIKSNYLTSVFIEQLDYKSRPIKYMTQELRSITFLSCRSPQKLPPALCEMFLNILKINFIDIIY